MGNSTTKSLLKSNNLETPTKITFPQQCNTLSMYSVDEQKEILALRQQLNQDIKKEKTHLLLSSLELDKNCIIYLIQMMIKYNIKKKAYQYTSSLIQKSYNPIHKIEKTKVLNPYIINIKIIEKQISNYRNDIINKLSNYVTALKQHFGDDISYILQDHFDLTTYYQDFMKNYKKSTFNMKNINWMTLKPNDINNVYSHFIQQYSHQEWQSVVKPHPNKKGHKVFNANYLKLKSK